MLGGRGDLNNPHTAVGGIILIKSEIERTTNQIAYNSSMPEYLDLDNWKRRDTFQFFLHFDKPYFNVCVQLDVTNLVALCRQTKTSSFLAYHYLTLRVANEIEEFHYRLREGGILIHPVIHGGSTLLLPNETFSFVYFDYYEDFERFAAETKCAIDEVRSGDGAFLPRDDHDALIHYTTVPWISFTSFSHARNWGREDSIPKIAFGRFTEMDNRILLPMSVEVHHSLMDGLHVGRFINKMEEALRIPDTSLNLKLT
jgi:chloramphenicol O-acetyltransferase type A